MAPRGRRALGRRALGGAGAGAGGPGGGLAEQAGALLGAGRLAELVGTLRAAAAAGGALLALPEEDARGCFT